MSAMVNHNTTCTVAAGRILYNGRVQLDLAGLSFGEFIKQAYQALNWHYPKFYKMSSLCQLATVAARYLLQTDPLKDFDSEAIALVVANKHATLSNDQEHVASFIDRSAYYPSPSVFVYTLPNILIGEWCIQYNIKGQTAFFVQPQPDWDFLLGYSQLLLQDPDTQCCITGWVDYHDQDYQATLQFIQPNRTV